MESKRNLPKRVEFFLRRCMEVSSTETYCKLVQPVLGEQYKSNSVESTETCYRLS